MVINQDLLFVSVVRGLPSFTRYPLALFTTINKVYLSEAATLFNIMLTGTFGIPRHFFHDLDLHELKV